MSSAVHGYKVETPAPIDRQNLDDDLVFLVLISAVDVDRLPGVRRDYWRYLAVVSNNEALPIDVPSRLVTTSMIFIEEALQEAGGVSFLTVSDLSVIDTGFSEVSKIVRNSGFALADTVSG